MMSRVQKGAIIAKSVVKIAKNEYSERYSERKAQMKVGFIGCGNMASAMIRGMLSNSVLEKEDLCASALTAKTQEKIRSGLKISCVSNKEAARISDVLFLAVKPQYYEEVIREIKEDVRPETIIVTIAPGKTLSWLEEQFGSARKFIRTMPNTPAMVGEGMTGVCPGSSVTREELSLVIKLLSSFGKAEVVPEHLLDVVTSVSGSSPAYVFLFIEAMADGAVADGMPRDKAYKFAAQAVLGSAKMVLETGLHPGVLKDMVCSPGGTTIEAVRILEEKGLRSAVIEAEKACVRKSRGM